MTECRAGHLPNTNGGCGNGGGGGGGGDCDDGGGSGGNSGGGSGGSQLRNDVLNIDLGKDLPDPLFTRPRFIYIHKYIQGSHERAQERCPKVTFYPRGDTSLRCLRGFFNSI